jgi:predicted nucleotidyltransferase
MKTISIKELTVLSEQIPQVMPYIKILVLFGSQAKGTIHEKSDWDFAIFTDQVEKQETIRENNFTWLETPIKLGEIFDLDPGLIDIVEINHASPLLSFQVARDGKLLYERTPGDFIKFQSKAWRIYADTEKFRKAEKESIDLWLQKKGLN